MSSVHVVRVRGDALGVPLVSSRENPLPENLSRRKLCPMPVLVPALAIALIVAVVGPAPAALHQLFGALDAVAQAGSGAAPSAPSTPTGATPFEFIFGTVQFFLLAFFVYYMLVLRPQQLREEDQVRFLKALKNGEEVITSGGILGKVAGIADEFITVEIAQNVRVRVPPAHVSPLKAPEREGAGAKGVRKSGDDLRSVKKGAAKGK